MYIGVHISGQSDAPDRLKSRRPASIVPQDGLSGAGNGPSCDDLYPNKGVVHRPQNRVSWSLPGPLYDFSITYTETQRVTERGRRNTAEPGCPAIASCLSAPSDAITAQSERNNTVSSYPHKSNRTPLIGLHLRLVFRVHRVHNEVLIR